MSKLKIYCDGGARGNPGPAAAGFVIYKNGSKILQIGRKIGFATNNFAEYKSLELALEASVEICKTQEVDLIEVFADSQLVIKQITGQFKIKKTELGEILGKILTLEKSLPKIKYNLIVRGDNKEADRMVNLALDGKI